jgi:exodeoxyribonuclease VII large subunit
MRIAEPSYPIEERIPGASAASAVRVSTLTQTAKDVIEGAFLPLWVRGEVTDFKSHRNGHWYFCLRDGEAQIRCVVWSRDRRGIPAPPDDGMQVAALGQLSVYPARGEMQFVVRRMEAEGDGLWRKQLERTRARLAAEGLLAPERKRALPRFPRRVAVVTSSDGAALHDIAAVIRRRCPSIELVVIAARVQGDGAPDELCAALERLARWGGADVAIIGRGGGGREDLWAFNDERVARAVAACPVPVVSAVGHEIDMTICVLVADLRAPTPSAAAEAVSPVHEDIVAALRSTVDAMRGAMDWHIAQGRERLRRAARDTTMLAARSAERRRSTLQTAAARLHALSPLATLSRGFAVARSEDGRTLGKAAEFAPGMPFDLLLADGIVRAKVRE